MRLYMSDIKDDLEPKDKRNLKLLVHYIIGNSAKLLALTGDQ